MKSILVHFDGGARCAERLHMARHLAEPEAARITALFTVTPPLVEAVYPVGAEAMPVRLLYELHAGWRQRAVEAFESANAAQAAVWAESGLWEDPIRCFSGQALYADLLVLGQHDPEAAEQLVPSDFVSGVLLASGRPAVVLPYAGRFDAVGRRVMVAWKPGPQAARALSAALPVLRRAQRVKVVEGGAEASVCRGGALDVTGYLALHGVQADRERIEEEPAEIGEVLLSRAADFQADLLVMGCYGHSRARELVLGGATRTVLRSMTLPVLLSH